MELTELEAELTKETGSYVLVLKAESETNLTVGSAGEIRVKPGYYVYTGSAFGPGGVLARVRHHFKKAENPHWHIDYLRAKTRLAAVWYAYGEKNHEHNWAHYFAEAGGEILLTGFGASDCRCSSHLFFFTAEPSFAEFKKEFEKSTELLYSISVGL